MDQVRLTLRIRTRPGVRQAGDRFQVGQSVAVMEAMKMGNRLTAHRGGIVKEILVQKGSEVATGDVILHIE